MNHLPLSVKEAILDRLEGWELIEFLQIPIERIVSHFEVDILENFEDVIDFVDIKDNNKDGESEDYS